MDQPLALHEARLNYVLGTLVNSHARSLLDLGCGSGALLKQAVVETQFRRILGIEVSPQALAVARRELAEHLYSEPARLSLVQGSCLEDDTTPTGFDAAALVETIEHVDPRRLAALEHNLFGRARPGTVVITTPNHEYNVLYGLEPGELRDADHRFEWSRSRFRAWSLRLARQYGYQVAFSGIGEAHPEYGCPTQAARFSRHGEQAAA